MKIIECEQLSPEWFAARCGIPSASNFERIITTKGEPSKQREKYLYQLAGEFVSGIPEESYSNFAMIRGIALEEEARNLYQIITGESIQKVGFCVVDDGFTGCSPDALVGDYGLLQIKCPLISTHVGYLLKGTFPTDYFQQVQGELFITGRKWSNFMSYYPGLKPLIIQIKRDEEFIKKLENELKLFVTELTEIIIKIKENQ